MIIYEELVAGGDLYSYISHGEFMLALPEPEVLMIIYQVLKGIEYLHSNGIVHRDIKVRIKPFFDYVLH